MLMNTLHIVCLVVALTIFTACPVQGALTQALTQDPQYRKRFTCRDAHNTVVYFRCSGTSTDPVTNNKMCNGDAFLAADGDGTPITGGYDPCQHSTCLGVECPSEAPYLLQMYKIMYILSGSANMMYQKTDDNSFAAYARCVCLRTEGAVASEPPRVPPIVHPDSPEAQPNDAACRHIDCHDIKLFAHTPTGLAADCTCCNKPTDELSVVPPMPDKVYTCSGAESPDSSSSSCGLVPDMSEFISVARSLCPLTGSGSPDRVPDSVLASGASDFCCYANIAKDNGGLTPFRYCGEELIHMNATGEVQCQSTIEGYSFSCCATVSSNLGIVNQGNVCARDDSDAAAGPLSVGVAVAFAALITIAMALSNW